MEYAKEELSVGQICRMIDLLDTCMNDCLYVYDFINDYYYISPKALKRFALPSNAFHEVVYNHGRFVYPPDVAGLQEELNQLLSGQKAEHNLEYRWLDRDGRPVWINCRGNVRWKNGTAVYMIGCINEIGVKPKADNLSGLLGDSSLQFLLQELLPEYPSGYFMRLGLDDFKEINEKYGMEYGDMILQKTAECIASCILPGQKLYRIVADEFVMLDLIGSNRERAVIQYKKIRQSIDRFIEANHYDAVYTISAGILECRNGDDSTYSNLMKLSEFSLNEAKRQGKNRSYIFKQEDYEHFLHKKELAKELRKAVYNGFAGFEAYYQPLFLCAENTLYGAEALMRFHSDRWGMVSPAEFIPILEETGLIIPVGRWMLHEAMDACRRIRAWLPDFRVSINVSYVQVSKSDIINEIMSAVEEHGLLPGNVVVELTESGLLESDTRFGRLWSRLKEHGIRLALDDFGTGYSNFHYLYDLRPDIIKIDRSFTAKALENDYEYNLLSLMSDMVHNLNLKVCVEGIETEDERQRIVALGPDYSQGFFFGRPCPYEQFVNQFVRADIP